MAFLLDTNCWTQVARDREHAADVRRLLIEVPPQQLALTDFAFHSLAILMHRHDALQTFPAFIDDVGIGEIVSLSFANWERVVEVSTNCSLDVDDAYQYAASELNGLTLVSLDGDFDRTPRGRFTPAIALQRFRDEPKK